MTWIVCAKICMRLLAPKPLVSICLQTIGTVIMSKHLDKKSCESENLLVASKLIIRWLKGCCFLYSHTGTHFKSPDFPKWSFSFNSISSILRCLCFISWLKKKKLFWSAAQRKSHFFCLHFLYNLIPKGIMSLCIYQLRWKLSSGTAHQPWISLKALPKGQRMSDRVSESDSSWIWSHVYKWHRSLKCYVYANIMCIM